MVYRADAIELDLLNLSLRPEVSPVFGGGEVHWHGCDNSSSPVTIRARTSFIELPSWNLAPSGHLRFKFRTVHSDGLLLFQRGRSRSSFIAMEMADGYLYFVFSVNHRTTRLRASADIMNNSPWHSVAVTVDGTRGKLTVDSQSVTFTIDSISENPYLGERLYIGGLGLNISPPPQLWTATLKRGFIGCLQDVMVNSRQVDLSATITEQNDDGLTVGCRKPSELYCFSSPCHNNGKCIEGWNSFECDCHQTAYFGDRCEIGEYEFFYSHILML